MMYRVLTTENNPNYGKVGEYTGCCDSHNNDLYNGDIVAVIYKYGDYSKVLTSVICKGGYDGGFFIMGFKAISLHSILNKYDVIKVVDYKDVTNEILKSISSYVRIKEIERPKKMTIKEIEKELGYKIEIIGE